MGSVGEVLPSRDSTRIVKHTFDAAKIGIILSKTSLNVIITLGLKNSKTSPGALFLWEAWEVISSAKIRLFSEQTNFLSRFFNY